VQNKKKNVFSGSVRIAELKKTEYQLIVIFHNMILDSISSLNKPENLSSLNKGTKSVIKNVY
jgi:hypothetical protein